MSLIDDIKNLEANLDRNRARHDELGTQIKDDERRLKALTGALNTTEKKQLESDSAPTADATTGGTK
jgi:septal ring factor EnvC (AmiA/AmiB activator)